MNPTKLHHQTSDSLIKLYNVCSHVFKNTLTHYNCIFIKSAFSGNAQTPVKIKINTLIKRSKSDQYTAG